MKIKDDDVILLKLAHRFGPGEIEKIIDDEEKGTEWGIQAFIGADINLGETINVGGQDLVGGLRANIRRRNQGEKGVDDAFALGGQFYLGYKFRRIQT